MARREDMLKNRIEQMERAALMISSLCCRTRRIRNDDYFHKNFLLLDSQRLTDQNIQQITENLTELSLLTPKIPKWASVAWPTRSDCLAGLLTPSFGTCP